MTPEGLRWGQRFTYDGFGNLTDKTVTKGAAPSWHVTVDKATNRILTGQGYDPYGSGNVTQIQLPGGSASLSYTPDNRLKHVDAQDGGDEHSVYAPAGDRLWKKTITTSTAEKIFFRGPDGRRPGEYKLVEATSITFTPEFINLYFAGKPIYRVQGSTTYGPLVTNRVGSVALDGVQRPSYYPYGEEKSTITGSSQDRFATYYRDAFTNFDYALQRYYHSGAGRFLTPDPYRASGGPAEPGSWNRYAYVPGDPVNFNDPSGLFMAWRDDGWGGGGGYRRAKFQRDMKAAKANWERVSKTIRDAAPSGSRFTPHRIDCLIGIETQ